MKDLWKNRDFKPMLLKEINEPFDSDDYLYELKFDGVRCLCFVNKNEISLISRNGKDITYLFPELEKIKDLVSSYVIFDGEIISLENGKPSFSKLSERLHLKNKNTISKESKSNPVGYVVFDILYDDRNLIDKSLVERKNILNKYSENEVFIKSVVFNEGVKLFNEVKKLGLEGIVMKLKNGIYHINSRTDDFIKVKNLKSGIFYIGGYLNKDYGYVFSLLLFESKNDKFSYVGKVSVSKKSEIYDKLLGLRKIQSQKGEVEDAVYVEPIFKCKIEYLEKSKNGHLRHPIFKKVIK